MLDAWAVANARWKKRIARFLYEDTHLRRAGCLHALCEAEAIAIRNFGLENPICVIPNGVALPRHERGVPAPWGQRIPNGARVLLCMGRLHPKKNLSALIDAWATIGAAEVRGGEWHLVIAGWDQGGYEQRLKRLVEQYNIGTSVHFLGPVFGREKDGALRNAAAFVLPSQSEGLPLAVLEAWSYGLPVLMTEACNLPEGFRAGAAARLSLRREQMARDLGRFLQTVPARLSEMGANGCRLVEGNFTWTSVAGRLLDVYRWLVGRGGRPATVRTT
jgi:glycosyltransferase involved in cell wall biosynthesis